MPDQPFLRRDDVAAIGSVKPKTISQHLFESQERIRVRAEGTWRRGKYADDPFPAPDGYLGTAPWWALDREEEIRAWFRRHPGRTKGDGVGGRPRKARPNG